MLKILAALLPLNARAWFLQSGKPLTRLLTGLSAWIDSARQYVAFVFVQLDPQKTTKLSAWETSVGITDVIGLTEQERRDRLAAQLAADRTQSIEGVQANLRAAGFDVYVHDTIRYCAEFRADSSVITLTSPAYIGLNFVIKAKIEPFIPAVGFSPQPIFTGSGISIGVQDAWLTLSVAKQLGGFENYLLLARVYPFEKSAFTITREGDSFTVECGDQTFTGSAATWATAFNIATLGGPTWRGQIRDVSIENAGLIKYLLPLNGDTTNYSTSSASIATEADIDWVYSEGPVPHGVNPLIDPVRFIVGSTSFPAVTDQGRKEFYFSGSSVITAGARVWDPDAADPSFELRFDYDIGNDGDVISQTNTLTIGSTEFRVYSSGGFLRVVMGGNSYTVAAPANVGFDSWRIYFDGTTLEARKFGAEVTLQAATIGAAREPAAPCRIGNGLDGGVISSVRFQDSTSEVLNMPINDVSNTIVNSVGVNGTLTPSLGWWRYRVGANRGGLLVNKIQESTVSYRAAMGEQSMQMGEPLAQMGEYYAFTEKVRVYNIPTTSSTWPHFVYVSALNFPEFATVPAARRAEFEALLLRSMPGHVWIGTLINYEA